MSDGAAIKSFDSYINRYWKTKPMKTYSCCFKVSFKASKFYTSLHALGIHCDTFIYYRQHKGILSATNTWQCSDNVNTIKDANGKSKEQDNETWLSKMSLFIWIMKKI